MVWHEYMATRVNIWTTGIVVIVMRNIASEVKRIIMVTIMSGIKCVWNII